MAETEDRAAILKRLQYQIGEARHEGAGYTQTFEFKPAELEVLSSLFLRPDMTPLAVRAARQLLDEVAYELGDQYDGAPDSPTLWMAAQMQKLHKALALLPLLILVPAALLLAGVNL